MTIEMGYLAAFLVGLMGGVHCVGMCGGIVTALSLGQAIPADLSAGRRIGVAWSRLLAYNVGRILSYSLAGALLGGVGLLTAELSLMHQARLALQVLAGLFMLALGLYLGGWWFGLARLERMGGAFWKRLEPLGRALLPVRTWRQALGLGLVWGWLPCGLVYSALIWSISSGGVLQGALLMLSFGLGTLPTLLLMGVMATRLSGWLRRPGIRALAGLMVMGFGVVYIVMALHAAMGG